MADTHFRRAHMLATAPVVMVALVARALVTGMSGAGKSTVLRELQRRGHVVVDTDHGGWTLPNGTWDEPRLAQLLTDHRDVVVSGTMENQSRFYDRFEHVVLLSAPLEVLLQRLEPGRATPMASRQRGG